jgi:hypothetical protein
VVVQVEQDELEEGLFTFLSFEVNGALVTVKMSRTAFSKFSTFIARTNYDGPSEEEMPLPTEIDAEIMVSQ